MACTEYFCDKCKWHEFNNKTLNQCPKCGNQIRGWFDEPKESESYSEEGDE